MTGLWLLSYVVLWALLLFACLFMLALAREIEALHKKLDTVLAYLRSPNLGVTASDPTETQHS